MLNDYDVLASVPGWPTPTSNALAESFVDTFKSELIADRFCRTRLRRELAVVEYIGWYNAAPPVGR
jgi:transposase InsO family protein